MQQNKNFNVKIIPFSVLSGYFLSAFIYMAVNQSSFLETDFSKNISVGVFIIIFLVSSAIILGYGSIYPRIAFISLPVICTILGLYSSYVSESMYVALAYSVICGTAIYFSSKLCAKEPSSKKKFVLGSKHTVIIISAIAFFALIYIIASGILRYFTFGSADYNTGFYSQLLYIMRRTGIQTSTLEAASGNLLSHFAVHISPFLYLLVPFFTVAPHPITLVCLQAAAVTSSVIPLYLICRSRKITPAYTVCLCATLLIFPASIISASGTFSELTFLLPLLLWFILFAEKRKILPSAVFALLTLSVHENAAIYMIFFCLYFMLDTKKEIKNTENVAPKRFFVFSSVTALFSLIYLIVCISVLSAGNVGLDLTPYNYASHSSIADVVKNIIVNPSGVIQSAFTSNKLMFILSLLLPSLPVLFLKSHKHSSVLLIPLFVLNIITQGTGNSSILFASSIAATAVLIYLSALTVSENQAEQTVTSPNAARRLLSSAALVSIVCALLFYSAYTQYRIGNSVNIIAEYGEQNKAIIDVIEQIPDNASVSASDNFISHLACRPHIYRLKNEKETGYVIIDLRDYTRITAEEKYTIEYYENLGYRSYIYEENCIAVMVKPS